MSAPPAAWPDALATMQSKPVEGVLVDQYHTIGIRHMPAIPRSSSRPTRRWARWLLNHCWTRRSSWRRAWFAAARRGDMAVLQQVLRMDGCEINARGNWGKTALHLAVEGNHEAVVALLLEHQADANITDHLNGDKPLHVAAYHGFTGITRLLLQNGASASKPNSIGRTPAALAAQPGGGPELDKLRCYEILTGLHTAVVGRPVLTCRGIPDQQDVYFYGDAVCQ